MTYVVGAPLRGDLVITAVLVLALAMTIHAIGLAARAWRQRIVRPFDMAIMLLAAIVWVSLLLPLVSGRLQYPNLLRYGMPMFIVPCGWVHLVVLGSVRPRRQLVATLLAGLTFVVPIACFSVTRAPLAASVLDQQGTYARCARDLGLSSGFASYWYAKPTIYFSDYRLSIAPLAPDDAASIFRQGHNRRWLERTVDNSAPFEPNFVLMPLLDPSHVGATFGQPSQRVACGDSEIWIFDHILSLPPLK